MTFILFRLQLIFFLLLLWSVRRIVWPAGQQEKLLGHEEQSERETLRVWCLLRAIPIYTLRRPRPQWWCYAWLLCLTLLGKFFGRPLNGAPHRLAPRGNKKFKCSRKRFLMFTARGAGKECNSHHTVYSYMQETGLVKTSFKIRRNVVSSADRKKLIKYTHFSLEWSK